MVASLGTSQYLLTLRIEQSYPAETHIPETTLEEIIPKVADTKILVLDAKDGFHQVKLDIWAHT